MPNPNRNQDSNDPCVWVQAGVLSFRACHRGFDCENCELFHAIRGTEHNLEASGPGRCAPRRAERPGKPAARALPREVEALVSAYLCRLTEGCDVHLDLPYSPGHFWLRETGADEVLLGFDCQTLRILFPIEDFILPKVGVWIKRGEPLGWIQRGHLALPLPSPISGEVLEINQDLVEEIKREGFPQEQRRWLIQVRPHEPLADVPELLKGQSMLRWYQRKLSLVREYLSDAMEPCAVTGETLNDGGKLNPNLEEVLGSDTFRDLLERLFQEL